MRSPPSSLCGLAIAALLGAVATRAFAQAPAQPAPAYPPPEAAPAYPPPQPAYGYAPPPPAYAPPPPPGYYPPPPPGYYPPPQPGYYSPPPPGYYPPPQPRPDRLSRRTGLTFGFALGGGSIYAKDCLSCGGGFALDLHLGVMLNPRIALLADYWGLARDYTDRAGGSNTLTSTIISGAVQVWVLDRLWLEGGLGVGHINFVDSLGVESDESAGAFLFAAGLELLQAATFSIDLHLRTSHAYYDGGGATNVACLGGLNWY